MSSDFYNYLEAMKDDLEYINNILVNTGINDYVSNENYNEILTLLDDIVLHAKKKKKDL